MSVLRSLLTAGVLASGLVLEPEWNHCHANAAGVGSTLDGYSAA